MKIKDLNIGVQLRLGFAALLLFVVVLSMVSYLQNKQIQQQIEIMYSHPLQVKPAIYEFKSDILAIQRDLGDIFLSVDEMEIAQDLNQIEIWKANASRQIEILDKQYLGQRSDMDSLKHAYIKWNSIHDETIRMFHTGKIVEAANRTRAFGISGKQAEVLLKALQTLDTYAKDKSDSLYANATKLSATLKMQLLFLVVSILLLSLIINYSLMRNIRKPLTELTDTTRRFQKGDMEARSSYALQNEFGVLSDSFNSLAESIQMNMDLNAKAANLAGIMLGEDDSKKFFQATLNALATHTGSQMAAVYLLSENKKSLDYFESIGLNNDAKQSFSADNFEGEFGSALSACKVQHIKNIPEDTRFMFQTVSGKFIPREIITIPILAGDEVIGMISLASVGVYSKQSIQLIDNILSTLSARVEGILAYRKIKEFSEKLEHQNSELEAQKTELTAQSAELMEQNAELEMQKKQLDEASQFKTNFLSNMSHELRTPLNSVIALSGVLSRRLAQKIPKEEYSYLEVIERNGKHLLDLINDILDISRIEAGHEEIEITAFNANDLIAEVVNMILPQAREKNIELLQIASDSNITIRSDADKYRHILQNIIGNAVKFTEKGKVVINTLQSEKNITITVTDTGIGIAEAELHKIFDEFRQADSSTSRKFGGTGLGLAIAKKFTNLLGGNITVKSVPGKGSEFTLTLPLIYTAENRSIEPEPKTDFKPDRRQTPPKPVSGSPVKTILLVEDSEPAIIQLKDFMEESGYQILVAHDGGEALGIIANTIPDAMILDLMMPGIDGFEVLKTIREEDRTAHIPVLILTAKQITKEELKFLKRNNIHQLIQKGDVNRKELLNAVTTMVTSEAVETVKPHRETQTIEGKPVVLAVEDNPDNMLTVKALLADKYSVIEAVDGNEAVEMAKKHLPNLILMDIALPEKDGIEAFKAIRKLPKLQHIPVIALTASAMTNDRETILAHGFDAYIPKPINEHIFFKTINEALYGK